MSDVDNIREMMEAGFRVAQEKAKETGQKAEDMLFTLGKNPEAKSVHDFNSSGEVMPFICMSVKDMPEPYVPGCRQMDCDGCGKKVWMSPATFETFEKIQKKLCVCMECVMTMAKEEGKK